MLRQNRWKIKLHRNGSGRRKRSSTGQFDFFLNILATSTVQFPSLLVCMRYDSVALQTIVTSGFDNPRFVQHERIKEISLSQQTTSNHDQQVELSFLCKFLCFLSSSLGVFKFPYRDLKDLKKVTLLAEKERLPFRNNRKKK